MDDKHADLSILFADITGSTRLYEDLGDTAARGVVAQCFSLITDQIHKHEGTVIKTIGDEIMCTFPTADDAIAAAVDMQSGMQTLPAKNADAPEDLKIKIGLHHGPAIRESGDVFGDAVNVSARMTSIAKGGQIITTHSTVALLSPVHRACTRHIDRVPVKGKSQEMDIFEVIWQPENMTMVGTAAVMPTNKDTRLRLQHSGHTLEIEHDSSGVVLGRGRNAQLLIDDTMVSREHARIECRRGKFYLVDQSTNGTYVQSISGTVFLRREEFALTGRGKISLGRELTEPTAIVVIFECL